MSRQTLPWHARLSSQQGAGAWCAKPSDLHPYIQLDLYWPHKIRSIAIQGMHTKDAWVTQFTLSYTDPNNVWINYTAAGIIKVV